MNDLNIEILNKRDNILLSRIEIEASISFAQHATPSISSVQQAISKQLEIDPGLIVVKEIKTSFGHPNAKVLVYQYLSKDELNRIEPKKKEKKQQEKKPEAKKS